MKDLRLRHCLFLLSILACFATLAAGGLPPADTDGDGLTDADEAKLGTDLKNPDTDGDRLLDGAEVAIGTNPLKPDTDGDGVPDGKDACPLVKGTGADGCQPQPASIAPFRRGDANADGKTDISDALEILGYLFLGSKTLSCLESADVDDQGSIEITDAIKLLTFLFLGGSAIPAPGPFECGPDPTDQGLGCAEYSPCAEISFGGEVHGYVSADIQAPDLSDPLRLPGVTVFLVEEATGVVGPKVLTDVHGWYSLPPHPPGSYRLCMEKDGFVPRCGSKPLTIGSETVFPADDAPISPVGRSLWGKIIQKDGAPCFSENEFFGTLSTSKVTLLDKADKVVAGPVIANSAGKYLIPGILPSGSFHLRADCGATKAIADVTDGDFTSGKGVDLVLPNEGPVIQAFYAAIPDGYPVRTGKPGQTLLAVVEAQDSDKDTLHYRWGDGTPDFPSKDSPTLKWTLQPTEAMNLLFVEVTDGKGGYVRSMLAVSTAVAGIHFGGRVSSPAGEPIPGALVTLNGQASKTGTKGSFRFAVPESDRYILNVKAPGYVPLSMVFHDEVTELDLRLDLPQRTVIDPTKDVEVEDMVAKYGAKLFIPANSLVDASEKPAAAPLKLDLHSFDLGKANALPGDGSAIDKSGAEIILESHGAVWIEVTDDLGNVYQPASDKPAHISIPLPCVQCAPPKTQSVFRYDPDVGIWTDSGHTVTLTTGGGVSRYEGSLSRFDVASATCFTSFEDSTCIRLQVPDRPDKVQIPLPFTLRVTVPFGCLEGANYEQVREFLVNNYDFSVDRLPTHRDVTLSVLIPGTDINVVTVTVNSGNPQQPFDPVDGNPGGIVCGSILPPKAVASLYMPRASIPYLSRPGPSIVPPFDPAPRDPETNRYYLTIDPRSLKRTLADFKRLNGFDDREHPTAYYYNAGDLGLGREMHCINRTLEEGGGVACYVTNYGVPGGPPETALQSAIPPHSAPGATVAMEYSPVEETVAPAHVRGFNKVKFFVYTGTPPRGDRRNPGTRTGSAVLDSQGPKSVPQICLTCHGGSFHEIQVGASGFIDGVGGASFREFDVFSFRYLDELGFTLEDQQETFRKMNALVKATQPNSPINALINGMYSPHRVEDEGSRASDGYVPEGWRDPDMHLDVYKSELYNTIPKVYCRTCHIAQGPGIDFTRYDAFNNLRCGINGINNYVYSTYEMPHAEVPFKKFWFSRNPYAPAFLRDPSRGLDFTCPQ